MSCSIQLEMQQKNWEFNHQLCAITTKKDFFLTWSAVMGGMRMFTEDDFEWFRFIERLKKSGMPLKEIKEFIDLYE